MIEAAGQGWLQLVELVAAFVLCALIGFERELRRKSAGLRTYALVGVASALFTLVSKYGFDDILRARVVVLDPSRIAAQIVSGIGFIGGGVIFMRRDVVRGLTTAASVWLTAAIGMACGAGLLVLACVTTAGYFVIMLVLPALLRRVRPGRPDTHAIRITYQDGRGLLRTILVSCTGAEFRIDHVRIVDAGTAKAFSGPGKPAPADPSLVAVEMQVHGHRPLGRLIARLGAIDGVRGIETVEDEDDLD